MPLIETESLILKTYDLAEADRIVLFLTQDHGIVRGVAKGAKRLKSKFGSGLEPFTVVNLTYFQKEVLELVSIQRTDLVSSYFALASDPDFLQKFSYLADLLIESSPPHDPNETLYRMVRACLDAAAAGPTRLDLIGLYFEVWLLRLTGYLPDWKNCGGCGRSIGDAEPAVLGPAFRLICAACGRTRYSIQVEPADRLLLFQALRQSPAEFLNSSTREAARVDTLSNLLKRVMEQALGREVRERPIGAAGNNGK
jgi:DNA repair protein RecO (recombination protein O)